MCIVGVSMSYAEVCFHSQQIDPDVTFFDLQLETFLETSYTMGEDINYSLSWTHICSRNEYILGINMDKRNDDNSDYGKNFEEYIKFLRIAKSYMEKAMIQLNVDKQVKVFYLQ